MKLDDRFKNKTVVCLASGPSITKCQVEIVRNSECPTIAVNNTFQLAPWCDILFAADLRWWYRYFEEASQNKSELWTIKGVGEHFYKRTKSTPRINEVDFVRHPCLGKGNVVSHGGNSGYIAINLAYLFGANKIVLVGYDHQHTNNKTHWHGDHDKKQFTQNAGDTDRWLDNFDILAGELKEEGVDLVNCSISTAITSCRRGNLEDEV